MNMELGLDLENARSAPSPASSLEPTASPTDKPRIWTVFATWFVAALVGQIAVIVMFVLAGAAIGVVLGAQGANPATVSPRVTAMLTQPIPALILSLLPFQLVMFLVVVLAAKQSPEPLTERLGLLPATGRKFNGLSLAGLAAGTLSLAMVIAIGSTLAFSRPGAQQAEATVSDGSWLALSLLAVILSLIPAVVEEIVFRGYIQRRLLKRWSPTAAIAVSTVLFAILHADSLQHIVSVIPLGIVTGWLAYRTDSVKPGIIVHAIHNAGAMAFAGIVKGLTPSLGIEGAGGVVLALIVVLGAASIPAVIALFRRQQSTGALPTPALTQSALQAV